MTSPIKVNNVQNQCGQNIINESSNTITIGASGDTIALASGASQTGFGRTGTVNWQTTIKTSGFTAANGEGYFIDTNSGGFTVNLPAGSAGDIVAFKDYRNTFDTGNLILSPNGTDKIGGINLDATLDTESQSVTLIFTDSTRGWLDIHDSTSDIKGTTFIAATGGTVTTSGNCKIHTFTGPGTFCVSALSTFATNNIVSHLVIAGGASAGGDAGGGGGAGGYREVKNPVNSFTASPLDGFCTPANQVTVTATAFPITVGAGGASTPAACGPASSVGNDGSNSVFSTITSAGGGGGGAFTPSAGRNGGSGGGGRGTCSPAGTGNTPPVTPAQGFPGATTPTGYSGGGGGATGAGTRGAPSTSGGAGGPGATSSINGSPVGRAGGGGGGTGSNWPTVGPATDGGGAGGVGPSGGAPGSNATANTGGGGGGGSDNSGGGAGGSGLVIIRYKFQ